MTANKENLRKWVAALRSGEFNKGRGALEYVGNDGKTYNCCLGVAERVYMREFPDAVTTEPGTGYENMVSMDANSMSCRKIVFKHHNTVELVEETNNFLHHDVQQWLGLPSKDPQVRVDNSNFTFGVTTLSNLNDLPGANGEPSTFELIAKAIERTYKLNDDDNDEDDQ